jgi:hypothetical protein
MYFLAICLIVAMFGTLSALAGTGVPNSLSAYQLTNDFVSPMGGPSSASAVTIASCNMMPYGKPTLEDMKAINTAAINELTTGSQALQSMSLYNCDKDNTCKGDTKLALLYLDKSKNYETAGFLPVFQSAVQNLKSAIAKFAYLDAQGYPDAMVNLKKSVRNLTSVYLTFADEFLIDALHLRFSNTSYSMDECVANQIILIEKAVDYYAQGAADFMDICLEPVVGTQSVIGSFFLEDEWHLFRVLFDRLSMAFRERGAKQRALGNNTEDEIKQSLSESVSELYVQAAALGNQLGNGFLSAYGSQLLTAIATLSRQLGDYRAGLNPLGYNDRYVPLMKFDDILQMAKNQQVSCNTLEQTIRSEDRAFDKEVSAYKIQMTSLNGDYKNRTGQLTGCGAGLSDSAFRTCVESVGDALFVDCPLDLSPDAFDACLKTKGSLGVIGDKYRQIKSSDLSLSQARLQFDNYGKEIENQNASMSYRIQIRKNLTSTTIEVLKDYQDNLKNACSIQEFNETVKIKGQPTQRIKRTTKTFSVKNTELIADTAKEIDLAKASLEYDILSAQDPLVIKNLLLRQSEALIGIDMAVNSKNAMIASFDASQREKENLLVLWDQNLSALTQNSLTGEAIQRILTSDQVVELSQKVNTLSHYSYLAAKALEYRYAKPLVNIQVGSSYLNMNDLYKCQSAGDFSTFLNDLDIYNSMLCGEISFIPTRYYVSLAKHILGWTDKNLGDLDGDGYVDGRAVADVRYEKFQEFLNEHIDANRNLTFTFKTSVNEFPLAGGRNNIKIWQGAVPCYTGNFNALGFTANLDFKGNSGNIWHKMLISQTGGHTLTKDNEPHEYYPIGTLALYNGNISDVTNFTDFVYPFVSRDLRTPGSGTEGGSWAIKFGNKSAAVEQWTITLKEVSDDPASYPNFPFGKLKDITFYFDAIGE